MSSFEFAVPGGIWIAMAFALAFVVLCVLEYRRVRRLAQGRRRVLMTLRVLTAALGFGVATQPSFRSPAVEESPGRVVVLFDDSASMAIGERAEEARALRQAWANLENVEFRRYSGLSEALPPGDALRFEGGDSRLGDALRSLRADDEVGAVVVVSDGGETGTRFEAEEGDARVVAVPIGDPDIRDDAIAGLFADPMAFLRQPGQVRVLIRRLGATGAVPVTLSRDGRVVDEQLAQLSPEGEGEVVLRFTPRQLGRSVYEVEIPQARGDEVPTNNRRQFMVNVVRDRLRVLLVAGRPTWDVRFLRAFLERDASIDLISFFILRSNADMTGADPDELALIPFPTDELFREHLGSFDVIFFQDFDYGPYDMAGYLPGIARYIRRGGSFAMIGGQGSFGAGGYASTPLAEVLPVEFRDAGRVERAMHEGEFKAQLADAFVHHPIVRLVDDAAANGAAWAGLSPLVGANRIQAARDDAHVLLVHPDSDMPLLTVGEADEGRVLALAADTSWRWGMTSAGEIGDASHHGRFWDRALRWLSRDPVLEPARITTDAARYAPLARMRVGGTLRDARYSPLPGSVPIELRLLGADGDVALRREVTLDAADSFDLNVEAPATPGVYTWVAFAGDDPIAEMPLVVEGAGDELADVRVQRERLETLAAATGGEVHSAASVPRPDTIDATRRRVRGVVRRAPFATLWAAGMLVLLLAIGWWLRRRWGEI